MIKELKRRKSPRTKSLPMAVDRFVSLVVQSPETESAWLSGLSYMEELAAKQILRNISPATPPEFISEIEVHAADEMRHSLEFERMRPIKNFQDPKLKALEQKMRQLTGSFVGSYFGNALLGTATSKHVAYVHGALTIEQFPFQLYSSYLKVTQLPEVIAGLPAVLADESGHLALGRKMRDEVSESDRLSLSELNEIEKDMCLKLVERLWRVVSEFNGTLSNRESQSLAKEVHFNESVRAAWLNSIAKNLNEATDEAAQANGEMLFHAVLFARKKHQADYRYLKLEEELTRALARYLDQGMAISKYLTQKRLFQHFRELIEESDDMGASHLLDLILQDEDLLVSEKSDLELVMREEIIYQKLCNEVAQNLIAFNINERSLTL